MCNTLAHDTQILAADAACVMVKLLLRGTLHCDVVQVNVEEVKREHKKAADAVVEAVHTALAEGLQQAAAGAAVSGKVRRTVGAAVGSGAVVAGPGSDADTSTDGGQETAAAAGGSSPSSKCNGSAEAANGAAVKKRRTMLDMVEGDDSDEADSDDE